VCMCVRMCVCVRVRVCTCVCMFACVCARLYHCLQDSGIQRQKNKKKGIEERPFFFL
jgi:hypothetical protein